MNDTGRKPLEYDRNGARISTHGLSGYARGCKCPPCSAAHAEDRDTRRTAARAALGLGRPAADDKWTQLRTIRLSPRVADLIEQLRGDEPAGTWIRGAVLEKLARDLGVPLEVLDPSPHLAPRRNRGGRNGKQQQREEGRES
jgi:hypothetical protein